MIDLQRYRDYEIDHEPGGWPAIQMKEVSALVDEIEQQRARVKELEAINLGLTKTLLEEESEKAKLVGALGKIGAMPHYDYPLRFGCSKSLHDRYECILQTASEALAAYRKQGSE